MTKSAFLSIAVCGVLAAGLLTGCSHNDAAAPPPAKVHAAPPAPSGTPDQQIQAIQNSNMPPTLKAQQIENVRQQNHQLPNGSPMPPAPAAK